MKYKLKYIYSLFVIITLMITNTTYAQQYPGGVSSGTTRGYKVDYYNGAFTGASQFGAGTTNATPSRMCYSSRVTGTEFINVDYSNFGLEYSGILEVPVTGSYTFSVYLYLAGFTLYIDGNPVASSTSSVSTTTIAVPLTAGDHAIKLKYRASYGVDPFREYQAYDDQDLVRLRFTAVPAGSGITNLPTNVDGRFVRTENSKLTAWYKASNFTGTASNVGGLTNMASDFTGNGNLAKFGTSGGQNNNNTLVNFNPAVQFSGGQAFGASPTQKGLSMRGATRSMFLVENYSPIGSQPGVGVWKFFHRRYQGKIEGYAGLYTNGPIRMANLGGGGSINSPFATGYKEPKLLGGFSGQSLDPASSPVNNPFYIHVNGLAGGSANVYSNVRAGEDYGLMLGGSYPDSHESNIAYALIPEAIYYPFELDAIQKSKVNTYLAVKYGISMPTDYVSTTGTTIFSQSVNTGYTNRIFGIGREEAVQGLYQKQSQSQMGAANAGHDFMVLSKGTTITTTNALNSGVLAEGDYMLFGDNAGALASQSIELPTSFVSSSTCSVARLGREWKAQVTGNPGNITLRVGNSTFKFGGTVTGLVMLVDTDNNGNFEDGTVTTYPVTNVVNGIATFANVPITNGNVITFGWSIISPGGVSNGLKLWTKADLDDFATGNVSSWNDLSPNFNHLTRSANANVQKQANQFNFNPAVRFGNTDNVYLQSTASLGMNGSNTYAEFYVLKGIHTSGLDYDEFITLGGANHRWENAGVGAGSKYFTYGNGTAGSLGAPTTGPIFSDLALYSNTRDLTGAVNFRSNGEIRRTLASPGALSLSGNFRIGSDVYDDTNGNYASLYSPELIVYNTTLSDIEIRRVNSYLGIKYSIPMADGSGTSASDYLSSSGATIWSSNATHKYGMFGIGRDDCSGLNQKQSKAYFGSDDNVTIGKNTIAATNEGNTNEFAANNNFVIIAHDNGAFTGVANNSTAYALLSCNPYRYARTWKVKNTGGVTGVQMKIGNTINYIQSNWSNIALMIDANGDGDFSDATVVTATSLNGGVATFDNVTLPNDATFTLAYTVGTPGGLSKPTAGTTSLGSTYVNGLAYKLYNVPPAATRDLSANTLGSGSDLMLSTGYYNNASDNFETFFTSKRASNFGFELRGKILAPRTGTYTFRSTGADDQLRLVVNNTPIFNITTYASGSTVVNGTIDLTAGQYYDFVYTGATNGSGINFNLTWNGNAVATFEAISDTNFFVSPNGPSAWYMADDLDLSTNFAEGTAVATWKDLSGNANALTATGNPTYYNTNKAFITNYNPSVYFTGDYLGGSDYVSGFAYGKQGKSIFAASANNTGTATTYTAYGKDTNGNLFGLHKYATGQLALLSYTSNTFEPGTFYGTSTVTTDVISGRYSNHNLSGGTTSLYANGKNLATIAQSSWNTIMNDNAQFFIGAWPDELAASGYYTNNMNEVIYYPWDLSDIERQKVNSYLAIKWGTTLDQSAPTDYLASDGTIVWNSASVGLFKNDITVIGRDDCGAINQRQSTSTDGNDIVAMGNAAPLAVNNASNTNNFTADKSFLAIAHNNAALAGITDINLPSILTTGTTCYSRLDREWQAQVKGTVGPVSLEMGKTGAFTFTGSIYKPVLLVRSTADYSTATVYQPTKVLLGKAYFDNVVLANGNHFTIAYIQAAPGGVKDNLTIWVDAGKDVYTDEAGTTLATIEDETIAYLKNQASNASIPSFGQSSIGFRPKLKLSAINYNSGFDFDGTNDRIITANNVLGSTFRQNNSMTFFQAGFIYDAETASSDNMFYHSGGPSSAIRIRRFSVDWANDATNLSSVMTGGEIYAFSYTTNTGRMYKDAKPNGTLNTGAAGSGIAAPVAIGGTETTGDGHILLGETIVYRDDKGESISIPMRKIASYLGVKYGFTQNAAGIGNAYIASDETPIYNYASHWNRITAIGRDDCSALEQKQAVSQNAGALVKISADATNGLAANNAINTATIVNDKTFLVYGDDNKSITWTDVDGITVDNASYIRLERTWRVKETKTVNDVYLRVPSNSSLASAKLPSTNTNPLYLLVSNSGDFTANPTMVEMILDGDEYYTTYNFNDGDYYTFGTRATCFAPGGVAVGLTTWYRADNKAAGSLTSLNDETGNINMVKYGTGAAAVVASTAANNYNRYLQLTSGTAAGSSFATANNDQSSTALTSANTGMLYAVSYGLNKDRIFTVARSGHNVLEMNSTSNHPVLNNVGALSSALYPAGVASTANIWAMRWNGTQVVPYTNNVAGTSVAYSTAIGANNANFVGIGGSYVSTTYTRSGIAFNEAFSFNRVLDVYEQEKIDTYLAIKYGQKLSHNYYGPGYDGTNAAANTIYDTTTYPNRVFGVGHHIAGCLTQNQSRSVLAGSMLKISVDGAILGDNSQDASKWNGADRVYALMGDDGLSTAWKTTELPALHTTNTCAGRITRQWKVVTTNTVPSLLVTIPDNTSAEATKLEVLPEANLAVYMIINDTPDFAINSNQQEYPMVLNTTTKEWETSATFDPNTTKYITFIYRPVTCGNPCLPVNPSTSRARR